MACDDPCADCTCDPDEPVGSSTPNYPVLFVTIDKTKWVVHSIDGVPIDSPNLLNVVLRVVGSKDRRLAQVHRTDLTVYSKVSDHQPRLFVAYDVHTGIVKFRLDGGSRVFIADVGFFINTHTYKG